MEENDPSFIGNTPDISEDEEEPYERELKLNLLGIFDQSEEVQENIIMQAHMREVFNLYCDSEKGRRLILNTKAIKESSIWIHIWPEYAEIKVGPSSDQEVVFEYNKADAQETGEREVIIQKQFDGVELKMTRKDDSTYVVHTTNLKEEFAKMVETLNGIINDEFIFMNYHFSLVEENEERVSSDGYMIFSKEKLNFLLDYFTGNLPQSLEQFNSAQTLGLAIKSLYVVHKNLVTDSIDDVIAFVENMLRLEVWENSENILWFQNGLLMGHEDKLFEAVAKYNEPSGLSQILPGEYFWDRIERIINSSGSSAIVSIMYGWMNENDNLRIRMYKAGDDGIKYGEDIDFFDGDDDEVESEVEEGGKGEAGG